MKVLVLVPNRKGYAPGQRGSIELWEPFLKSEGIDLDFIPFETEKLHGYLYQKGHYFTKAVEMAKGYFGRLGLLKRLDEYDAVFVYREAALLGPAFLERAIARHKPIIYELDDPLFIPYRSHWNGYLSYLKFFGKIKEIIRMSKVVIVNSTHIREYAEQFNDRIWQVPSIVDTGKYVYRPFPENLERPCVGWSGSLTTIKNLKLVEKPLKQLSDNNICDIHFIGGTEPDLAGVNYTAQNWSADTEVEDLRKIQIGLIPLPVNPWNPYKFIMKTAQYMALGIVPVGTPMASNTEVIRHGENGFLAATDEEWLKYTTLLVEDAALRDQMSRLSAQEAEEKYSLNANKAKILEAFRAALK